MRRGNWIRSPWIALLGAIAVLLFCWHRFQAVPVDRGLEVVVEIVSPLADELELFYTEDSGAFSQQRTLVHDMVGGSEQQEVVFRLPRRATRVHGLRLDPGRHIATLELRSITLRGPYHQVVWKGDELARLFRADHDVKALELDPSAKGLRLHATGPDPYISTTADIGAAVAQALSSERPVLRTGTISILVACLSLLLLLGLQRYMRRGLPTVPLRAPDILLSCAFALLIGWLGHRVANSIDFIDRALSVRLDITAVKGDDLQIFYASEPNRFKDGHFVNAGIEGSLLPQEVDFDLPQDSAIHHLRIDVGMRQDTILLNSLTLLCNDALRSYTAEQVVGIFKPNEHIRVFEVVDGAVRIVTCGNDPFIMSQQDLGPAFTELHARAGNGPTPWLFALICAIHALLATLKPGLTDRLRSTGRLPQMVLATGFLVMLYLPLLAEFLPVEPFVRDTEKRPLAPRPAGNAHALMRFPKAYTAFYGDHFPFRKPLFRWNSFFHVHALRSSPLPDRVLFGKEGWMFLNKDRMMDYYRGFDLFTPAQLDTITHRLDRRKTWLAERGIDYYLFVPPLASSIYPEMLPSSVRRISDRTGFDQVKEHLQAHCQVKIIDVRADLLAAKDSLVLYYKTDIHWNRDGALIAYQRLLEAITKDHPELSGACLRSDFLVTNDTNDLGDLAMQLAMNDVLTRVSHDMTPLSPWRATELPQRALPASPIFRNASVFMRGPDPEAPRLLMFRDSFGVYLIPLLSEHFSTSTYAWTPVWIPELVEVEKPDIVVHELMEVFLDELLDEEIITFHRDAQSAK